MTIKMTIVVLGLCGVLAACNMRASSPNALDNMDLQALIDQVPVDKESVVIIPAGRHVLKKGLRIENRRDLLLMVPAGAEILVDDVDANVVEIVNCSGVTIDGGAFQHIKPLSSYECHGSVLNIRDSQKIVVRHAILNGCGAIGVDGGNVNGLTIQSCAITNNTFNAIYLNNCQEVRLWDNIIENNANMLQAYKLDDIEASGNLIRNNGGYWRKPAVRSGP